MMSLLSRDVLDEILDLIESVLPTVVRDSLGNATY